MFPKQTLRAGLLLVLFSLFACVPKHEKTLQVSSNHWIGYEPLYLAQDQGFYRNANIKISELSSASQVAKAFEQGVIDVAALTLDEAIRLTFRDDNYEILWVLDYSFGGDAVIAQSQYQSLSQLKGQKVGLEEGAVSKYLLSRAAQKHQMTLEDFEIVPVHLNQQESEFVQGNIAAVSTFDPTKTRLLEFGANQVFSSREIPGEIVDILVVKKSTYAEFGEQIKALITGYLRAVKLIQEQDKSAIESLAQRSGVSRTEVLLMLENMRIPDVQEVADMLYSENPSLEQQIKQLSGFFAEQGETTRLLESHSLMPTFKLPL